MYLERSNGGAADKKTDDKVFEAYNGPGGRWRGSTSCGRRWATPRTA